jgi:hypothetical protein
VGCEVLKEHGGEIRGGQLRDPMTDVVHDFESVRRVDMAAGEFGSFAGNGHVLR